MSMGSSLRTWNQQIYSGYPSWNTKVSTSRKSSWGRDKENLVKYLRTKLIQRE